MLVMHGVNIAYLVLMTVAAEVPELCKEKKSTCMSVRQPCNPNHSKSGGGGFAVPYLIEGSRSAKLNLKYDGFSQVLCYQEGHSMCLHNSVNRV
jgi:hypothetical protein